MPDPVSKPIPFIHALADNAKHVVRWAARDMVKASIYMTPSMPFFWGTRTPQSKYRGLLIHPEKGMMTFKSGRRDWPLDVDAVHINELTRTTNSDRAKNPNRFPFTKDMKVAFSRYDGYDAGWSVKSVHDTLSVDINPHRTGMTDAYKYTFGPVDAFLNKIGMVNNKIRKTLHQPLRWMEANHGVDIDGLKAKRFSDTYINAALSYTPYFWSKAEFARLWDNARMDQSIERAIDGAAAMDGGEFKQGLNDMWHTLTFKPLANPQDEARAVERIKNDVSPADIFDPLIFEEGHRGAKKEAEEKAAAELKDAYARQVKKQGFTERLLTHKAHAQNRMDSFRREHTHGVPATFVQQVAKPQRGVEAAQVQDAASFAEKEIDRATMRQQPDGPDVTIH